MTTPFESPAPGQPAPAGEVTMATGLHGTAHIVQIGGDLDVTSAVRVRGLIERLLAAHPAEVTTVVLDLTLLRVLAAAGLEALLSVQEASQGLLDLRVVAATQPVLVPLQAVDLVGRLKLYETLNEALDLDGPEVDRSSGD